MFLHLLQEQRTKERAKSAKALLNAMFLYSEVSKAEQSPAGVELGCLQTDLPTQTPSKEYCSMFCQMTQCSQRSKTGLTVKPVRNGGKLMCLTG